MIAVIAASAESNDVFSCNGKRKKRDRRRHPELAAGDSLMHVCPFFSAPLIHVLYKVIDPACKQELVPFQATRRMSYKKRWKMIARFCFLV